MNYTLLWFQFPHLGKITQLGQITSKPSPDIRLTHKEKQPKEEAEMRAQAKWMWANERKTEQLEL